MNYLSSNLKTNYPLRTPGPDSLTGEPLAWYLAELQLPITQAQETTLTALDLSTESNCRISINGSWLEGGVRTTVGPWVTVKWANATLMADARILQDFSWPLTVDCKIDARALSYSPRRVQNLYIRLADNLVYQTTIAAFASGYNCDVKATTTGRARKTTRLTIDAEKGLGIGSWSDCQSSMGIRSMGGASADAETGNVSLTSDSCYRFEPVYTRQTDGSLKVVPGQLRVYNDCVPCCSCTDFATVYDVWFKDLYNHVVAARAKFTTAKADFQQAVTAIAQARQALEGVKTSVVAVPAPGWFIHMRIVVRNNTKMVCGPRQIKITQTSGSAAKVAGRAYVLDAATDTWDELQLETLPATLPTVSAIDAGASVIYNIPLYVLEATERTAGSQVGFTVSIAAEAGTETYPVTCTLLSNYNKD